MRPGQPGGRHGAQQRGGLLRQRQYPAAESLLAAAHAQLPELQGAKANTTRRVERALVELCEGGRPAAAPPRPRRAATIVSPERMRHGRRQDAAGGRPAPRISRS